MIWQSLMGFSEQGYLGLVGEVTCFCFWDQRGSTKEPSFTLGIEEGLNLLGEENGHVLQPECLRKNNSPSLFFFFCFLFLNLAPL